MPHTEEETGNMSTKELIKRTALRSFALKGYHETSMQDIADEISMNKATLFFHYQSKCNLFLSVLEELSFRFHHTMKSALEENGGEPLERMLYRTFRGLMKNTSSECILLWRKTLLMVAGGIDDDVREGSRVLLKKVNAEVFRDVFDAISAKAPRVSADRVETLVTSFYLFTQSMMDWRNLHRDFSEAAVGEMIEKMWRNFWNGSRLDR